MKTDPYAGWPDDIFEQIEEDRAWDRLEERLSRADHSNYPPDWGREPE